MKEALKVISLLLLVCLIAVAPWALLRRQTFADDTSIHKEAVLLEMHEAEETEPETDYQAENETVDTPEVMQETVEDHTTLISQALSANGTYSVVSLTETDPAIVFRVPIITEQLTTLWELDALPPLELGKEPDVAIASANQITCYDQNDASHSVRLLAANLYYQNRYFLSVTMDMDTNLLYSLYLINDVEAMDSYVDPTRFLSYLNLPENAEIAMEPYGSGNGFYGFLYGWDGCNFEISFSVTENEVYCMPSFIEFLEMMPF